LRCTTERCRWPASETQRTARLRKMEAGFSAIFTPHDSTNGYQYLPYYSLIYIRMVWWRSKWWFPKPMEGTVVGARRGLLRGDAMGGAMCRPCRGSLILLGRFPVLTHWATLCRPSGAFCAGYRGPTAAHWATSIAWAAKPSLHRRFALFRAFSKISDPSEIAFE
jgi:hypothetical protein